MNPEFGTDTIEAPIDGWMMAANPQNPEAAKELLYFIGTADAQEAYLAVNPMGKIPAIVCIHAGA